MLGREVSAVRDRAKQCDWNNLVLTSESQSLETPARANHKPPRATPGLKSPRRDLPLCMMFRY